MLPSSQDLAKLIKVHDNKKKICQNQVFFHFKLMPSPSYASLSFVSKKMLASDRKYFKL